MGTISELIREIDNDIYNLQNAINRLKVSIEKDFCEAYEWNTLNNMYTATQKIRWFNKIKNALVNLDLNESAIFYLAEQEKELVTLLCNNDVIGRSAVQGHNHAKLLRRELASDQLSLVQVWIGWLNR